MRYLLFLAFLVLTSWSQAQTFEGWSPEDQFLMETRLKANITRFNQEAVHFRDIQYVPIKFHLVADSEGQGRVAITDVFDQLCRLNQDFSPHNIQFFLHNGLNFIDEDLLYDMDEDTRNFFMMLHRDTSSINVFIVKELSEIAPIVGAYFDPLSVRDWIVVEKQRINESGFSLTHELGHYFSLLHPFHGWGPSYYSTFFYGLQAPAITPMGAITELVDGSNCEIAGDFLCDTPADYLFIETLDCQYNGGVVDPNGDPLDPDEQLFMGLYLDCEREDYYFSPTQVQLMQTDLSSPERAFLQLAMPGNTNPIEEVPSLLTPANGEGLTGTTVEFSWTPVENAEAYLLEISVVPNFSVNNIQLIIYGTSLLGSNLDPGRRYFWRVTPYNSLQSCQPASGISYFDSGNVLSQENPEGPDFWSVSPNPMIRGGALTVYLANSHPMNTTLEVVSASGQIVHQQLIFLSSGEHRIPIETSFFSKGVYWLRLRSEHFLSSQKFILL